MYIAVTLGSLLLGGVVLDGSTDETQTFALPQAQPPAAAVPMEQRHPSLMDRSQNRMMQSGRGMIRNQMGGVPRNASPDAMLAPTDALPPGGEGMLGQPTAPTSGMAPTDTSTMGMGTQSRARGYSPMAPTQRRPSTMSQSAFRPMSHGQLGTTQRNMPQPNANIANVMPPANYMVGPTSGAASEKAFSGYRAPSGVSPYLNLFRRGGEGVDNYNTLVRPELDQRFLNRQMGNDVRNLQQDTRLQQSNLQRLNQDARTLQGVGTPQFYMNQGNYFPMQGQ